MRRDAHVVVTDLDGCLLDARTYEWAAALPALDTLKRRAIPLVRAGVQQAAVEVGHDDVGVSPHTAPPAGTAAPS